MNHDKLDKGIRDTVRLLRENGFDTTDSGDGISKPPGSGVLGYPHVHMVSDGERLIIESQRCAALLGDAWTVQGSYDPANSVSIITAMRLMDGAVYPHDAPAKWIERDGAHWLDLEWVLISVRERVPGEFLVELQVGELWSDLESAGGFTFSGELDAAKDAAAEQGDDMINYRIEQLKSSLKRLRAMRGKS